MSAINGVFERRSRTFLTRLAVSLAALADYGGNGSNRWVDGAVATGLPANGAGARTPWRGSYPGMMP